jgi:hypothetical protein
MSRCVPRCGFLATWPVQQSEDTRHKTEQWPEVQLANSLVKRIGGRWLTFFSCPQSQLCTLKEPFQQLHICNLFPHPNLCISAITFIVSSSQLKICNLLKKWGFITAYLQYISASTIFFAIHNFWKSAALQLHNVLSQSIAGVQTKKIMELRFHCTRSRTPHPGIKAGPCTGKTRSLPLSQWAHLYKPSRVA